MKSQGLRSTEKCFLFFGFFFKAGMEAFEVVEVEWFDGKGLPSGCCLSGQPHHESPASLCRGALVCIGSRDLFGWPQTAPVFRWNTVPTEASAHKTRENRPVAPQCGNLTL